MNMKFAFISRHLPTDGQVQLADAQGIDIVHIGDFDAFSVTVADVLSHGPFDGVIVVHPAAAMRLATTFLVGVYQNGSRPGPDDKPQFYAASLQIFDLRD